jgi:CheY-like chemotaxis protein
LLCSTDAMRHSALPLVDALADEARRIGASAQTDGLRAQVAFVRALADEIGRHHPSQHRVVALHDQLGEELSRLVELVPTLGARECAVSGVQPVDVLVVDDDDEGLRATAAVVRELGLPVRTARSGEEAVREYERRPAAVVLTDWNMPGMTGLELCQVLKDRDPQAYVILLTAHDVAEGARHGVDDFLRKPVEISELEVRLRAAAKLVQAMRTVALVARHLQRAGQELDA